MSSVSIEAKGKSAAIEMETEIIITMAPHIPRQSEVRHCVKVEVAVLGSLSLIVLMVSVDAKQQ